MFKKTLVRALVVSISVASPLTWAADSNSEVALSCPAGTKQFGGRATMTDRGVFCVKNVTNKGIPIAHGPYVSFHENGQKKAAGQHSEGNRTGVWMLFNEQGVKTEEVEFSGGDYHGKRVQYFPSGKSRTVEHYSHGKKDGLFQEFSEDGKLVRQLEYRADQQIAAK